MIKQTIDGDIYHSLSKKLIVLNLGRRQQNNWAFARKFFQIKLLVPSNKVFNLTRYAHYFTLVDHLSFVEHTTAAKDGTSQSLTQT